MTESTEGAQGVHDLIRQREQLRTWLSRLGEVTGDASRHVADRVRRDYEDRLRRVTEELSGYQDEIAADLERAREAFTQAAQRHTQTTDVLEESRLRHLIGEIDAEAWREQEARLQETVDAAGREAEHARSEVERLQALASDVAAGAGEYEGSGEHPSADASGGGEDAPGGSIAAATDPGAGPGNAEGEEDASPIAAAAEEEDADVASWLDQLSAATSDSATEPAQPAAEGGDLPWMETGADDTAASGWAPTREDDGLEFLNDLETSTPGQAASENLAEDDLAFLEELDRAISGAPTGARPSAPAAAQPTPPEPTAAPAASGGPLLCKECGAINEPHSWYCEVCGSEL